MTKKWLLKKIDKYSVVSFDIFDTLIERDVVLPSEIFARTAKKYLSDEEVNDFVKNRMDAERKARALREDREANLEEIYHHLKAEYDEFVVDLMEAEIAEEINSCQTKVKYFDIYEEVLKSKEHIFLISDMYLPEEVICRILDKCKITGYEKLYISNRYRVNKISGELFDIVKKENVIHNEAWLHLGDSFKADYLGARKAGIDAVLLSRKNRIKRMLRKCL